MCLFDCLTLCLVAIPPSVPDQYSTFYITNYSGATAYVKKPDGSFDTISDSFLSDWYTARGDYTVWDSNSTGAKRYFTVTVDETTVTTEGGGKEGLFYVTSQFK